MISAAYMAVHSTFRKEFRAADGDHSEIQPIDAPAVIAAGSHEHYDYQTTNGWTVLPTCVEREKSC